MLRKLIVTKQIIQMKILIFGLKFILKEASNNFLKLILFNFIEKENSSSQKLQKKIKYK